MTAMTMMAVRGKRSWNRLVDVEARAAAAERVLAACAYVSARDRALLELVYRRGMSPGAFARAVGAEPRTVRSRLKRLVARVQSPRFQFVKRRRGLWPAERREVAEAVILRGQSWSQTALSLGMSVHRVRQELGRVEALFEG